MGILGTGHTPVDPHDGSPGTSSSPNTYARGHPRMSARIRSVSHLKAQFGARILNLLHNDISGIDEQVRRGRLEQENAQSAQHPLGRPRWSKKPLVGTERSARDGGRA